MRIVGAIATAGLLAAFQAGPTSAVSITPDFTGLGTVRVDTSGNIVTSGGTDVTNQFKANLNTAIDYWESAITKNWNLTINFSLADLGSGTVGDAQSTSWLGTPPQHITEGNIRFNTHSSIKYFIDTTPTEDSEFNIDLGTSTLGGGTVNTKRRGSATSSGGASGRWDLLTLALHEVEHLMGFSSGTPILAAADEDNPSRHITIAKTMSGLPNDWDLPLVTDSAHIDGDTQSALFQHTVVASGAGEWGAGERAKITGVDILGVCQINECGNGDYNLTPVPEPGSGLLIALGMLGLGLQRRH